MAAACLSPPSVMVIVLCTLFLVAHIDQTSCRRQPCKKGIGSGECDDYGDDEDQNEDGNHNQIEYDDYKKGAEDNGDAFGNARVALPENCGKVPLLGKIKSCRNGVKIAGGYGAKDGEFPSYAKLNIPTWIGRSLCGGTLISDRHILTAAHCTRSYDGGTLQATFNSWNKDKLRVSASKVCTSRYYHSLWNGAARNDIAIVKLREPVEFTDKLQPACLPKRSLSQQQSHAVGLGKINNWLIPIFPERLQVLPVKKVDCGPWDTDVSTICFRANNIKFSGDTCEGDSGGPIFSNENGRHTVFGITSYGGEACNKGHIGTSINANTYNLRDKIQELLDECA